MPDGEEPVAEPTLESLNADMRAQSSLLRELATAVAQLTARDRVVDGEGAHGSGSGQRFAGQPTGSGGAAERPDLLELAQSGRVGAKSVSVEDDYLAVPELLQRADSGYEAVRPVSRVPGLFPLSTDLTNEYLKQDDRRLPAQEEYLWMSCFGAHMAALFVALDELLPYVPATNQDFTPYLARARNHAEAIDKAFRFRLAFLRRLNEIKRVHGDQGVLDRLQLQVAGVGEDVAADVDAVAKDAFGSDELGQRTLDLLSSSLSAQTLKSYAGRLSQFAEFCHDSENISPMEATTATVVRYVAWIGERGHIAAKSLQPYLSAINTFFELHNLVPIAKDSLHLTSARHYSDSSDIQWIKPSAVKPTLDLATVPVWDQNISTRDNAQAIKISLGSAGYLDTTKGKGTHQEQLILLEALRHATANYPMAPRVPGGSAGQTIIASCRNAIMACAAVPAEVWAGVAEALGQWMPR
eukprot:jgi/Tetstr1/432510/TSEL_021884.t1